MGALAIGLAASTAVSETPRAALPNLGPRFRIVRKLGQGGMGTVYEAVDVSTAERVALKSLVDVDAESLLRFKREFRALADLAHENLVSLYELFSSDDRWFFTMEAVDGVSLLAWVRHDDDAPAGPTSRRRPPRTRPVEDEEEEPTRPVRRSGTRVRVADADVDADGDDVEAAALDEARLRDAFAQLARGLVALHEGGRVHRDVKPSNILVAEGGRVVILDFGIVAELGSTRADDASIVGTPGYMAPEQTLHGSPPVPANDWYAYGVVLYEALAGRRPFLGTTTQVLAAKLAVAPPDLAAIAPDAPADLVSLCRDLLARDPLARPDGAEVLRRIASDAGRAPAPRALGAHALVGRRADAERLAAAAGRAREDGSLAVLVHAASGVGKSALVAAFLRDFEEERGTRALVLRGRCYEHESLPYKALDSLVDAASRALVTLSYDEVARVVPEDVAALAAVFPVLRRVRAIAARCDEPRIGSGNLKPRALRALEELLVALSCERDLVLAIDDLHWGDADSAAMLAELCRKGRGSVLVVATYRTEHRQRSAAVKTLVQAATNGARIEELGIGPVSRAALRTLAQDLLRGLPDAGSLADRVATEAGGSPYLALELARWVTTTRGVRAEQMSLARVIGARIGGLPADARRLLETIAVAGAPIALDVALASSGVGARGRRASERLVRGSFVLATAEGATMMVATAHDAVRETLLAALGDDTRREHHAALARELADAGGDVYTLARHWLGAWPAADAGVVFDAARAAAESAASTYAFAEAFAYTARAKEVAERAGLPLDAAFLQLHGEAAARSGHLDDAVEAFQAALQVCTAPVARAQLRLALAKAHLGQLDTVASAAQVAEGLAEVGVRRCESSIMHVLGAVLALVLHRCARSLAGSPPLAHAERERLEATASLLVQAGSTAWFRLDRLGQLGSVCRLDVVAQRLGTVRELSYMRSMAAVFMAAAGLRSAAEKLAKSALETLATSSDLPAVARSSQYSAHITNFIGRPTSAVREMDECLGRYGHALENSDYLTAVADVAGNLLLRGHAREGLGWTVRGAERVALSGETSALARGHTYRFYRASLLALLGRVAAGRKVLDEHGADLGTLDREPWRRGQWLAQKALFFAEVGGSASEFESVVTELRTLRASPRALPLQMRHFFVAQAMVRLAQLDDTAASRRRWTKARAELDAAATHPTHRAHLHALDAAHHAWCGRSAAAEQSLAAAEALALEHDIPLVCWDVARQRAIACEVAGDGAGARVHVAEAEALADQHGWVLRAARHREAVAAGERDPRWRYGA